MSKDARAQLDKLEDDRAKRLRLIEEAQRALASYRDNMGVLSASGIPTEKITARIQELRDAEAVHAAGLLVLEAGIEAAKVAVIEQRRKECEILARDAAKERDAHLAKLQAVLDGLRELEETAALALLPTGGMPAAKSLILGRKADHWQAQAQRLAQGLAEVPQIFDD